MKLRSERWNARGRHSRFPSGARSRLRTLRLEPLERRTLLASLVIGGSPSFSDYGMMGGEAGMTKTGAFAGEAVDYGWVGCSAIPYAFGDPYGTGQYSFNSGFTFIGSNISVTIVPEGTEELGDPIDVRLDAYCASYSQINGGGSADFTYSVSATDGVGTLIEGHHSGYWPAISIDHEVHWLTTTIGTTFEIDLLATGSVQATPGTFDQAVLFNHGFDLGIELFDVVLPDIQLVDAELDEPDGIAFEYRLSGTSIDEFQWVLV